MPGHSSISMLNLNAKPFDYSELGGLAHGDRLYYADIEYVWDYYDGPLDGMARADSTRLWFVCFREDAIEVNRADGEDPEYVEIRIYHAIKLTEEQEKLVDYWNGEFSKYVRDKPTGEYTKFYGPYENVTRMVISPAQIFGWFTDSDLKHV